MSSYNWFVQWASFTGVSLDIIGFIFLSLEWRDAMKLARRDFEKELTWAANFSIDGPTDEQAQHATQDYEKDVRGRTWFFRLGAVLILAGFVFQAFGSWPR